MNRNSIFGLTMAFCLLFSCQSSAGDAVNQREWWKPHYAGQAGNGSESRTAAQASHPERLIILDTALARIPARFCLNQPTISKNLWVERTLKAPV
jgi:hypothetical protein